MDKQEFLKNAGFIDLNDGYFHYVNTSHVPYTIIASIMDDKIKFSIIVPGDKRTVYISTAVYEDITKAYDELLNSIQALGSEFNKIYDSLKNCK